MGQSLANLEEVPVPMSSLLFSRLNIPHFFQLYRLGQSSSRLLPHLHTPPLPSLFSWICQQS